MLGVCVCFLAVVEAFSVSSDYGTFWQISDIHYDAAYSQQGDVKTQCHYSNASQQSPGLYGNYSCDSPWNLVHSAITAMKNVYANPDFMLWTGDTVPHVEQSSVADVYKLIENVTALMRKTFPNTMVIPSLGNHDAFPSNQMPLVLEPGNYYNDILKLGGWINLLSSQQQQQFAKGGYYSVRVTSKIWIVVLNSNLWYSLNNKVTGTKDPNDQFAWLANQLYFAKTKNMTVFIATHICPGAFERLPGMKWLYPEFNARYVDIIQEYSSTVKAHFCGHEHTDSFRLLPEIRGEVPSMMFLSPAVTPWKSPLPGVGANNPSVRLYHYSRSTGQVLDYLQYYLNLTEANVQPLTVKWKLEYQATKAFSLPDASPKSFASLVQTMAQGKELFQRYLRFNTVGYPSNDTCGRSCLAAQICAIQHVRIAEYDLCIQGKRSTFSAASTTFITASGHHRGRHGPPLPRYAFYIIGAMGFLILLLALIVGCLCVRLRRSVPFKYGRFGGPIN